MARAARVLVDCPSRKLAFASKAKAIKWLRHQRKQHRKPLIPYQCRHCSLWHLTSSR